MAGSRRRSGLKRWWCRLRRCRSTAKQCAKGLDYLVKHQLPDGHWEGDGGKHPVAMTGLAGLPLLMETAPVSYLVNIRKAADWLMDQSQPGRDGLIFSGHPSETAHYMEGHGLATLFLAGACRIETDAARQKKLTDVVTRAIKYIARAQSSRGGWYHTSRAEGHDFAAILPTVIQIQALAAAENARVPIPGAMIDDAMEYLKTAMEEYEKDNRVKDSSRATETAAALACHVDPSSVGRDGELDKVNDTYTWFKRWLERCQREIPVGRNAELGREALAHFYYAQALRFSAIVTGPPTARQCSIICKAARTRTAVGPPATESALGQPIQPPCGVPYSSSTTVAIRREDR